MHSKMKIIIKNTIVSLECSIINNDIDNFHLAVFFKQQFGNFHLPLASVS